MNIEHKAYQLQRVPDGHIAANALCRLGNQMFIAAAAMTYARRTNREFMGLTKTNVASDYPENLMNTIMRNVKYIDRSQVEGYYHLPHGPWLCDGFPDTDIKDIFFDDFFQDARCIDKEIAYRIFKPYEAILRPINELYGDLSNTVCINVRRGDYLQAQAVGFNVLTKEQIEKIINECFDANDKFIFVSDDIQWCKENFSGDRYSFADKAYPNKPEIDLYIQTQCKANVISNSTFSWWGAYLNPREDVVCPWPWFQKGKINPMKHVIPDHWLKVEF